MTKIGLITCANATQDLNCASIGCLKAINTRGAYFSAYLEHEALELTGIISCAGCPTLNAPEKILKRVKSLMEFNVDVIHFSFCMKHGCPFIKKYEKVIREVYPDVRIVQGSHADPPEAVEGFKANMKELLAPTQCVPQDMNDHIKKRVKLSG